MEKGREAFLRRYRLGSNRNYRLVYRRGKSTPSRSVVLIHMKGRDLKIGFSVSGKVGNAVTRNRLRRWMREDIRRIRSSLKCGRYIFVARPSMKDLPHEALTRELNSVLARAKLLREEAPCQASAQATAQLQSPEGGQPSEPV